jgi:hypothetical protein
LRDSRDEPLTIVVVLVVVVVVVAVVVVVVVAVVVVVVVVQNCTPHTCSKIEKLGAAMLEVPECH